MSSHRHRRVVAVFLSLTFFVAAAYTLGWSSTFSVKNVVVIGAPTNAESQAIQASIQIGEKLARIQPTALKETLRNFAWLDRSTVSKNWFKGTVTIQVWTRIPIAVTNGQLVDDHGHMFTLPGKIDSSLPRIEAASTAARVFAVKLLELLPALVRSSLVSIKTTGAHSARLFTSESSNGKSRLIEIIWGDLTNSDLKGRVYQALLALPENAKITVVDVSAPHAPIVK
jgi:cell division septal protein FtsQ